MPRIFEAIIGRIPIFEAIVGYSTLQTGSRTMSNIFSDVHHVILTL